MATNGSDIRGVIHGKTIELDMETGLPEGQPVRVTVEPLASVERASPPGQGLRRAFGAWADDAEDLDRYLEWNRRQRKIGRTILRISPTYRA
jgi:hypothetical protein